MTHRVNILPQCNKILVMEHGRITEVGTHAQLINKEGSKFAEFLQLYSNDKEEMETKEPGTLL